MSLGLRAEPHVDAESTVEREIAFSLFALVGAYKGVLAFLNVSPSFSTCPLPTALHCSIIVAQLIILYYLFYTP